MTIIKRLSRITSFAISLGIIVFQVNSILAQNIPPDVQKILKNLPPETLQKMIEENKPKGEMTFPAIPPQQYFRPPVGVAAEFAPTEEWFQSGSAITYELAKCIVDDKEAIYIKNVYVLYLDEEKLDSTFTTNQIARTASIDLKGRVERWQGKCNSKELSKAGSSQGGLKVDFNNSFHIRPRFFQSSKATGRVFGGGLNETVQAASMRGEPIASSYAKSENKSSYDPKVMDALRKAGFPIPDMNPEEYEKSAEEYLRTQGVKLDLDKASFYGRLQGSRRITFKGGSVPAIQVDFGISSGFEADMLVYRPEAIASGSLIPDALQNTIGAQAFVNLDNDDNDEKFDISDANVPGGDNDLVKVVLRIKKQSTGQDQAQFEVLEGPDNVRIYLEKEKKREFTKAFQKTKMAVNQTNFPDSEVENGEVILKKTLWVEGTNPHVDSAGKTKFKFSYWASGSKTPNKTETFKMTVLGIESIEWEGQGNSRNDDDNLDKDYNHRSPTDHTGQTLSPGCGGKIKSSLKPEAVRVFPGSRMKKDGSVDLNNPLDMVKVKVKLSVSPVEPINVYFRSFDVDDPGASDRHLKEVDDESTADDNRGEARKNGSKTGYFEQEGSDKILKKEFSKQEDTLIFQVTRQPGDNFRIVGNGDEEFLKNLENDDAKLNIGGGAYTKENENKQRIVDKGVFSRNRQNPEKAEIQQSDKYASKVLTVWRFFYGEVDYMEAMEKDMIRVEIERYEVDKPKKGQTLAYLRQNIIETLTAKDPKKFTNVETFNGENGIENSLTEIYFPHFGQYKILSNSAHTNGTPDQIVVDGPFIAKLPEDLVAYIKDDDENWGFKKGVGLKKMMQTIVSKRRPVEDGNDCSVEERYVAAYIIPNFTLLNSKQRNPDDTSPFMRNLKLYEFDDKNLTDNYRFNNSKYHNSENFWTIYLLMAYKGGTYEDGDPNTESLIQGLADKQKIGAHIFLESMIEKKGRYYESIADGAGEKDVIAHEIAHLFGAEHNDEGLMGFPPGSRVFSDKSLDKIRSAKHP